MTDEWVSKIVNLCLALFAAALIVLVWIGVAVAFSVAFLEG